MSQDGHSSTKEDIQNRKEVAPLYVRCAEFITQILPVETIDTLPLPTLVKENLRNYFEKKKINSTNTIILKKINEAKNIRTKIIEILTNLESNSSRINIQDSYCSDLLRIIDESLFSEVDGLRERARQFVTQHLELLDEMILFNEGQLPMFHKMYIAVVSNMLESLKSWTEADVSHVNDINEKFTKRRNVMIPIIRYAENLFETSEKLIRDVKGAELKFEALIEQGKSITKLKRRSIENENIENELKKCRNDHQ